MSLRKIIILTCKLHVPIFVQKVFNMGTSLPWQDSDIIHARCNLACKGKNMTPYIHKVTIYPGTFLEGLCDL